MEERRIALPFVKPASLIISTISKPDFFNGSLANNFVAKSLASLFISPLCRKFTLHTLIHTFAFEILPPYIVVTPPEFDIQISAITFEYLKAEIVNISKPYLENLPYK
jgi:hypothetical protein